MSGKTIVITGASDGIGAAAATRLAAHGHRVVIVGRSPHKTDRVAAQLHADHFTADFSDLSQVRSLAAALLARYEQIDVLANNAGGIFGAERRVTPDGHEITFQVNYLAPFLLTELLRDRLAASNATVINTSSAANRLFARFDLADLENRHQYTARRAYGNAKLAQIMHARELNRRAGQHGVTAVAFHPGTIATSFAREPGSGFGFMYGTRLKNVFLASPMTGADTLVYLAEHRGGRDFPGGQYFVKSRVARANPVAYNDELTRELWARTQELLANQRRPDAA